MKIQIRIAVFLLVSVLWLVGLSLLHPVSSNVRAGLAVATVQPRDGAYVAQQAAEEVINFLRWKFCPLMGLFLLMFFPWRYFKPATPALIAAFLFIGCRP